MIRRGVDVGVVTGRAAGEARRLLAIPALTVAGNHGLEIVDARGTFVHPEATAARPRLSAALGAIRGAIGAVPGVVIEDKGLTLSVHHRMVARASVAEIRSAVMRAADAVALPTTEGREVLEVRPDVAWGKGEAVHLLVAGYSPPADAPVLYLGDDRTDEDAFSALRRLPRGTGAGVIVSEAPPARTAARFFVRSPHEVARLLAIFCEKGPG